METKLLHCCGEKRDKDNNNDYHFIINIFPFLNQSKKNNYF